jgi:Holliday junction resolvasome RuvABC endonuclease subunit
MAAIIGVDLSLVSTGLARLTTDGAGAWLAETTCRTSKPSGGTLIDRNRRICAIRDDVLDWATPAELVVIEAPIFGHGGAGTFERAWLWGAVVTGLLRRDLAVVSIPPTTRSKFTAASGGADKAAVALAAGRMWQDWNPGSPYGVNDQADALALASIGLVLAGYAPPFAMPKHRTESLQKVPRLERTNR